MVKSRSLLFLFFLSCMFSAPVVGQQVAPQAPQRDPQAIAILQQSLAAMGRVPPADSVATGAVVTVAGSTTEHGTVRILTRGTEQTSEQLQMPGGVRSLTYSQGQARHIEGATARSLQMELVVTSQCPDFPLPILAGALNNAQTALQYVGPETLDGVSVHHIRLWSTFADAKLQHLAEFSTKDVWLDAASGLPRKLAFEQRAARGAAPRIPFEVFYSDYRSVSGVLYPFLIKKSLNGTPWTTITIANVTFNTALTDADFPVR